MTEPKDPKVEVLAELSEKTRAFEAASAELERCRDQLHDVIVRALRIEVGPSAIERAGPYDRQHIDRIRRAAGIPAKRVATVQRVAKGKKTETT